jgi:hypothetical protein
MKYVWHDGVIVRQADPFAQAEIYGPKAKKWFPFPESKDSRHSAFAAMHEGTPLTEKQVKDKIAELS